MATPATAPASRKPGKGLIVAAIAVVAALAVGAGAYFALLAPYSLNEKTFPDMAIRMALANQADKDGNGKISRAEAKQLESLDLSSSGVASLDGLDKFPNLRTLRLVEAGRLAQADFSKTKALTDLDVSGSGLSEIDVSMLHNLRFLNADRTGITELDIAKLGKLESLRAEGCGITELDVSKNTMLSDLHVGEAVTVTGLDKTLLREQYLMESVHESGIYGAIDGQGGGGMYDDSMYEFTYDADNMLTGYTCTSSASSTGDSNMFGYRYTIEDGRVTGYEVVGSSSYTTSATIEYDGSGHATYIWQEAGTSDSMSTTMASLTYDDAGRLASKTIEYDSWSNGSTFHYNDANQLTDVENRYDTTVQNAHFTYDEAGRIAAFSTGFQDFEFEYNDAGQVAKKTYWYTDENGERYDGSTYITFGYDDEGRVISGERTYDSDSSDWTYTANVTYDERNLVSRIDRHSRYSYDGETTENDGVVEFAYKRVFTAQDDPDVQMPLAMGDPTTTLYARYPFRIDVLPQEGQDPIAYLAADTASGSRVFV